MNPTKILIVDDRPENIFALSQLIAADDVSIFSARNADEALDLVVSHDFGLALMDVQMPNISGFQLARIIRGVKRCRNLPMIFLTAHQRDESFVLEGYETGAVDLLFKPLDPNVVRSKVRVFVRLDRQNQMLQLQMSQLERLREEAELANSAKSRFLANMSHEIRTPLSAVMGFADVLMQEQFSKEEREECASAIRRNGEQLLRLIDDILDISKIEAHHLEIDNHLFDFNTVIKDVNATLSLRASEKNIRLEFENELQGNSKFISDSMRVKQALLNIIGNAIKFTFNGSVRVAIRDQVHKMSVDQDPVQLIAVTVKDSGIGLTQDQASRLFQPFSQADASTRRSFGGTGLGLVISRQIARLLGGDLVLAHSSPDGGSEFEISFALPIATEKTIAAVNEKHQPTEMVGVPETIEMKNIFAGRKILVVDDVKDNRVLIERLLKSTGAAVTSMASGAEALHDFKNSSPDVILMDIQMPEMDGFETTEKIRRTGFKKPIIAVTAHAMKEEREHCKQVGCNWVITKPVNRVELIKTLTEAFKLPT